MRSSHLVRLLSSPPDGTLTATNLPRGDSDDPQTLNVRNRASAGHLISIVFIDYPVDP
ncbi:MAG: hypothetical protein RIB98_15315 [Acidimicrobiales bacterium]